MKVVVSGATGRIGSLLVQALKARGDEVTALSRDARRASERLEVEAVGWDPGAEPAPAGALEGRDAVVHLAGEDVGQRWTAAAKRAIRDSREAGTRRLVEGLRAARRAPRTLVSASASGFYGARGDERVTERDPPGRDWLADFCVRWERAADAAAADGVRVAKIRTGVVLDAGGGALAKMLPPFKAGIGGPVAGGRQYMPWIHRDDLVGLYLAALDAPDLSGPVNASAPEPVTNRTFSKTLGRVLGRPAIAPIPALAIKALYGEMAQIVTAGVRMVPARAVDELRHPFAFGDVEAALRDVLGR